MRELEKKSRPSRFPERYKTIEELRKYLSKNALDAKLTWPTEHLKELLKAYND